MVRLVAQKSAFCYIEGCFFLAIMNRLRDLVRKKTENILIFNLVLIVQVFFKINGDFFRILIKR